MIRFRVGVGAGETIVCEMREAGNSVFTGTVSTNTLNSECGDFSIQRDGTDVLRILTYTPTNGHSIVVDAQSNCGISSSWMFANVFASRTVDTVHEIQRCY